MWLPSSQVPDHCTSPGVSEELRHDARSDVRPELRVDVLDEHLASLELRVLEDLGNGVDRAAHDTRFVEDPVDVVCIVLRRPVGHDPLDLLLALAAGNVRREARVVRELGPPHCLAQPPVDVVLVRCDDHPEAVARLEDVRRRDALRASCPWGRRTMPSLSYSGTVLSSSAKDASISETSTT